MIDLDYDGETLQEVNRMSWEEVQDTYALPGDTYEYISEVEIPEGTDIRVGTTGPQPDMGFSGGGTEIVIRRWNKEIDENWFENRQRLDDIFDR